MKLNINGNLVEVSDESLSKALEDKQESFDITSEDLVVKSKSDFDTLLANTKTEAGNYQVEIGRKELLKGLGIETEGGVHKTQEKALEAITAFNQGLVSTALADSGAAPDKKLEEANNDILKLQGVIKQNQLDITSGVDAFNTYKKDQTLKGTYSQYIPENTIIPKSDMALILSNNLKLDINENNIVYGVGQDGNALKDDNLVLKSAESLIGSFFDNNPSYIKNAGGGSGQGNQGSGGGKTTYTDFVKSQSDLGHNPMSTEFKTALNTLSSENSIDMDA